MNTGKVESPKSDSVMQKLAINKRSLLRILLGVYLFPFYLVCFSLGVPPSDLPLCGIMFVIATFGLILAWRESRFWRGFWTGALIVSVLCGILEITTGQRVAWQHSKNDSNIGRTMPPK